MNIKVLSVNISKEKGTIKLPVKEITLDENGIQEDAHAGDWHRQISLLSQESIDKFGGLENRLFKYGEFAENITTQGINLTKVSLFDKFIIGDVQLEVTQIGKKCHGGTCAIFQEVGKCVMPKEGIFCRVLSGGIITPDANIEYIKNPLKVNIITLSDRAYNGEYEDKSGPKIKELLTSHFNNSHFSAEFANILIPDSATQLKSEINKAILNKSDIIITTGGTGIGARDITVDTIKPLLDKEILGIMEAIRVKYGQTIPSALLSRSIAGMIENSLIYTLPGSVNAVTEYINEITRSLNHAILTIKNIDLH